MSEDTIFVVCDEPLVPGHPGHYVVGVFDNEESAKIASESRTRKITECLVDSVYGPPPSEPGQKPGETYEEWCERVPEDVR